MVNLYSAISADEVVFNSAWNRDRPHLLWNQRWEYDKGPDRLAFREYVPDWCWYENHERDAQREAEAAGDSLEQLLKKQSLACLPEGWRESKLAVDYQSLFNGVINPGSCRS